MAIIMIYPLGTPTNGGFEAEIVGINPTHPESCLYGKVTRPGIGNTTENVHWNRHGGCRDHTPEYNIDVTGELADVMSTVRMLAGGKLPGDQP